MSGPVFFGTVIGGSLLPRIPETPCPEVFQYQTTPVPGDTSIMVTGLIIIMKPPIETVLYLFVHLQLQAVLPSKYVGLVELIDKTTHSSRNYTDAKLYRVRFPLVRPLPMVRLISLNSQIICSGPSVSGPVVTDIRLEHTLRPNQASTPSIQPYSIDPGGECGRAVAANPLVVGGRPLQRGQWPWLAAVFILKSLGLEFHCSGTIITRTFVLTVGHCMRHQEAGTMVPSDVVVYLGKFNLQQWEEPHSVIKEGDCYQPAELVLCVFCAGENIRYSIPNAKYTEHQLRWVVTVTLRYSKISDIHVHPEFDSNKYTADLALLRLKTSTEYNIFIQPVCLWSQSTELDLIVGHIGTVVGWGRDRMDNKMSPIPRVLEIPIVSTKECINSHSEFFFLTSSTTLCAGAKDGKGPCNGDSGGGLMLPVIENNIKRWQLRGLVSLSLLNITTQSCDLSQYVVFTDTAKFLPWIASVVNA